MSGSASASAAGARPRADAPQPLGALLRDRAAAAEAEPAGRSPAIESEGAGVFVPLQLVTDDGVLAFLSTTTVFGTPVDVTLAELALECFFPADVDTMERLRRLTTT